MPLESLRQPFNPDEPGRKLREVQIEHEPEKESVAREHWEWLKSTALYVPEKEEWVMDLGTENSITYDQILAAIVEAQFNASAAGKKMENLKREQHIYFKGKQIWMKEEETYAVNLHTNLYHALFLAETGRVHDAKELYEAIHEKDEFFPDDLEAMRTVDCLLDVLVHSYWDEKSAQEALENLKELKYDERWDLWRSESDNDVYYSDSQLLVALYYLRTNFDVGKQYFAKLQSTGLYDQDTRFWGEVGSGRELDPTRKYTEDQLLSVLIEAKIEQHEALLLPQKNVIPEERNF